MDNPTDRLTVAIADWLSDVMPTLGPDGRAVWDAMLGGRWDAMLGGRCDVGLQIRLRQGTISLVAISGTGRHHELHRQHVAPLRPHTGFAEPESETVRTDQRAPARLSV
jgi:hypothetical protein